MPFVFYLVTNMLRICSNPDISKIFKGCRKVVVFVAHKDKWRKQGMSSLKCKHLFVPVQTCFFHTYFVIWHRDWVDLEARTVWLCDTGILYLRIHILLCIASETAHGSILQHLWQTSTTLCLTSILLSSFLFLTLHLRKGENWDWRSSRAVQTPASLADKHP